jgi:hypothetical protein
MKDDEQVTYFVKKFLCLRNQLMGIGVIFFDEKLCALPKYFKGSMGNQPI